jgi:hypothetical protein
MGPSHHNTIAPMRLFTLLLGPVPLLLLVLPLSAQELRSQTSIVGGSSAVTTVSRASTTTPGAAESAVIASPSNLRWTLTSTPSAPWVVDMVGIGDGGTQAWASHQLNLERVTWTAVTEDDALNPQSILDLPFTGGANGFDYMTVEPASHGRAAAVTHVGDYLGGPHDFFYYDGLSTQPAFSFQVPVSSTPFLGEGLEASLSADGRWYSLGFNNTNDKAETRVYDAWSATPEVPVATFVFQAPFFYQYREQRLSGDGSRLLLATRSDVLVYDVATQSQLFHEVAGIGGYPYGESAVLDFDGNVMGRTGNEIVAWVDMPSGWVKVVDFVDSDWSFPAYWAAGISADGTTFAAAGHDIDNNGQMRLHVWDIDPNGSATKLWTWAWSQPSGNLADAPSGLSLSDDGKRIALSATGAGDGTHPELMVFDRDLGPTPIASLDVPGSLFDVEISPDGRFVVTGGKSVHGYVFGNGGELYALDLGGLSLTAHGTPAPGETLEYHVHGTPGHASAVLVGVQDTVPSPLFGFAGELGILPLISLPSGPLDATGTSVAQLPLPFDSGLIGAALYAQSITLDLGTLTGAWGDIVRTPVVP